MVEPWTYPHTGRTVPFPEYGYLAADRWRDTKTLSPLSLNRKQWAVNGQEKRHCCQPLEMSPVSRQ